MKTKLILTFLAFIISGTMVFAQDTTKTVKKQVIKTTTVMKTDSVYYTCTMHPGVKSDKPGICPECGMELVKAKMKSKETQVNKSDAMTTYICPMHPQVISDKPGKCPKCGMDLVVKK